MVENKKQKHRNKPNRMSDAEIMIILILFHSSGFRCFRHYHKEYVCKHLKHLFPYLELFRRTGKELLLSLIIIIKTVLLEGPVPVSVLSILQSYVSVEANHEPLKQGRFLEDIKGKLCADKGYFGQAQFENLFLNGIQTI